MGTVTIIDDDRERMALQASLSVLGRIVAMDAVDTIGRRFAGSAPGTRVNLVGTEVTPNDGWQAEQLGALTAGLLGLNVGSAAGSDEGLTPYDPIAGVEAEVRALAANPVTPTELLSRSTFDLRLNQAQGAEERSRGRGAVVGAVGTRQQERVPGTGRERLRRGRRHLDRVPGSGAAV